MTTDPPINIGRLLEGERGRGNLVLIALSINLSRQLEKEKETSTGGNQLKLLLIGASWAVHGGSGLEKQRRGKMHTHTR